MAPIFVSRKEQKSNIKASIHKMFIFFSFVPTQTNTTFKIIFLGFSRSHDLRYHYKGKGDGHVTN